MGIKSSYLYVCGEVVLHSSRRPNFRIKTRFVLFDFGCLTYVDLSLFARETVTFVLRDLFVLSH